MQLDTEDPDVDLIDASETTEGADTVRTPDDGLDQTEDADDDQDDGGDTFPRAYVEKLRKESARYRDQARAADTYAQRLHTELVRATGRLADPTDIPFDEAHIDDPDALAAAVEDLLARKPHLASRRPLGDIGQGQRGPASEPFSLLGLLKERT